MSGRPAVVVVEVERAGRAPLLVAWEERDQFDGEDEPPIPLTWPWDAPSASAVDVFWVAQPVDLRERRLHLEISATPLCVTA